MSTQNCCFLEDLIGGGVFKLRFSPSRGQKDRGFSGQPSQSAVRGGMAIPELVVQHKPGSASQQKQGELSEMFQVSRRILPARGDLDSSMRIWILEPMMQWRVRVYIMSSPSICFLLLKIKIIPLARNTEIMHF